MRFKLVARVYAMGTPVVNESQTVDSMDEAIAEQKRWLDWFAGEPAGHWSDIELRITKTLT